MTGDFTASADIAQQPPYGHRMKDLPPWIWIAAPVVLLILLRILFSGGAGTLPYFSKDFLLTKGEHAFYDVLRRSLPEGVGISMKVRLADVIGCSGAAWKQGHGGRISQKHLDFVLASTAILAAVELDDKTHQRRDRQERDDFLEQAMAAAGVPLVRVPAAANYDARGLREMLKLQVENR
jgi:hypothetical protein